MPDLDTACPACRSSDFTLLESVSLEEQHRDYAPTDPARTAALTAAARRVVTGYQMRRCAECVLEWASPMRAPGNDWYALAYSIMDLYPVERWEFARVLEQRKERDRVFDIGCGEGAFLKLCTARGLAGEGVDFAAEPVRRCLDAGLNASCLTLGADTAEPVGPRANVVTAFHVLEHMESPAAVFALASRVSSPDAVLYVAVPSARRPSRRFGERDVLDQPPHHLTRWSEKALAEAGSRCGWRLRSIDFEPLPLSARLWWIATRSTVYRSLVRSSSSAMGFWERVVRYLQYPYALVLADTRFRAMSAFSMLALFDKAEHGSTPVAR